jgi:hypothetical protein
MKLSSRKHSNIGTPQILNRLMWKLINRFTIQLGDQVALKTMALILENQEINKESIRFKAQLMKAETATVKYVNII